MTAIPCKRNPKLKQLIEEYAEVLKQDAHKLGTHGLAEADFYNSGVFRGAIERIRGQFSATMREKRDFVSLVLNHMQDNEFITDWHSAGDANRHDYTISLKSGKLAVIELKGCLDGNNTNIFERPSHAQEFIIWSVCTNKGADPDHNAWSGIHTRLSADIISREQRVDGLLIWDMICGTAGRPCLKGNTKDAAKNIIGQYKLPSPCIYLMPATIPSPRNNPCARAQKLADVEILQAFAKCFHSLDDEINFVEFHVHQQGQELMRTTRISRSGKIVKESSPTAIQRS